MKCLKLANDEGWLVALAYMSVHATPRRLTVTQNSALKLSYSTFQQNEMHTSFFCYIIYLIVTHRFVTRILQIYRYEF